MKSLGPLLGTGKVADVHAFGALALKLYKSPEARVPAFREAANLAIVQELELPTPKVHSVGRYFDRWGIVMDRAIDPEGHQPISAHRTIDLDAMVELHTAIHACASIGLPSLKRRLSVRIERAELLDHDVRARLLRQLEALPDGDRICHGDFHPWNIIPSGSGVMIVDWLDACGGPPAADVCRTYLLLRRSLPEEATRYVDDYAAAGEIDRQSVMDWLPVTAAARLAENVTAENEGLLQLASLAPTI